jgi:hypothetical protein
MVKFALIVSALLVLVALAIDCSASELSSYNLAALKGVQKITEETETPPTKTKTTWNIGMCTKIDNNLCPANADICGLTEVLIDKKYTLTQVVSFSSSLSKTYTPLTGDDKGIQIEFKEAHWGPRVLNAKLTVHCAQDGDKDLDVFKITSFKDDELVVEVTSVGGCANTEGDNGGSKEPPKKNKEDKGESWGWFTWIFIFMVLFLSIYIIGGAWFQYHKSNSIDFQSALREVLENFVDLLRGLPIFIKEIVEKVTGNNTRGEYSAV